MLSKCEAKSNSDYSEIYQYLLNHPGKRQIDIVRALGHSPYCIHRAIASMEDAGYLLYQEGRKLYAYAIIAG
jgi:hypothetical protein